MISVIVPIRTVRLKCKIFFITGNYYTTAEFARSAALLREYMPGCALTTDVITGFPGETDAEFAETEAFISQIAFSRLHVFPYSQRAGTPAAKMAGQVPKAIREDRARKLIALGHELARAYHESMIGTEREVLIEERLENAYCGYTREYVNCRIESDVPLQTGSTLRVRISSAGSDGVNGTVLDPA